MNKKLLRREIQINKKKTLAGNFTDELKMIDEITAQL